MGTWALTRVKGRDSEETLVEDHSVVLRMEQGSGVEVETSYQVTDDPVGTRLAWRMGEKQRFWIHFGLGPPGFADGIGSRQEEGKAIQDNSVFALSNRKVGKAVVWWVEGQDPSLGYVRFEMSKRHHRERSSGRLGTRVWRSRKRWDQRSNLSE